MAHPQSNVSLAKFGGLPSESWTFIVKKTMKPDAFLVKLQALTKRALPDPILLPVAPAGAGATEADRVAAENAANAERQRLAGQERSNLVKRVFKRAMPNWIRIKFLEQTANVTVSDLCTLAK